MRVMLERRLRALCFLEIYAISYTKAGNPCYFVRLCKENARIDEIVWLARLLFFEGIERKLLNWYFANIAVDEGRMPGVNPYYLVKGCISAAQTAKIVWMGFSGCAISSLISVLQYRSLICS